MGTSLRVLIVEDSEDDMLLLVRTLRHGGYEPTYERVDTPAAMHAALDRQAWDIVISDYAMPHFSGLAAHTLLNELGLDLPFILVSGTIGEESAVAAMQAGAHDYLMKSNLARLAPAVARELQEAQVRLARRQAEEQLRQAEARYRTLVEQIPAIIYIAALDQTSSTLYISPQIEAILGFSQAEWMADPTCWYKQLHPDDRARVLDEEAHSRATGEVFRSEYRLLAHDGRVVWMRDEATIGQDDAGRPSFLQGFLWDISDRKQAEEALKAERALLARRVEERTADLRVVNAELARAARLKDEFLAGMSHELRTPLNAILGLSEALQEQVYGLLNVQQLQTLRTIEASGRHLLDLITDILDLSKIEAGKLELDIGPVPVELLCQASLQLIKQAAHTQQLTVSLKLDSAVTTIQGDMRRLKQILVNLLSNAVKFTPPGGAIGLDVVGNMECNVISFTVWDTGIGITPKDIERLFQPFVQLDSRLARQYAGTGLGLSLVYRMVDLHGGSIAVESEADKGSRFTVVFPWQAGAVVNGSEPEAGRATAASRSGGRMLQRALIIEDSPTAANQVSRYLDDLGIASVIYPHGAGVVAGASEMQPDVVILDLLLPQASGWEVLQRLKADPRTQDIPVLLLSVVDEPQRGREHGAAACLVKPITREQLQDALARIVVHPERQVLAAATVVAEPDLAVDAPVILLAEDNASNITMLSDYLVRKGYRIVVAHNGWEAVEQAHERTPAVILMDIQMPGMDGLEATRRIRALAEHAATPIIALTALAMPGDRAQCLAAGANAYLSKPVSLRALVEVIEAQLHGT